MSEGEPLTGDGVTQGIVRIGDTVRRPLRPFSLTVQAYLAHLRDAGFTGAPLPLGVDEQGREVLSFVPGDVPRNPLPPQTAGDEVLAALARLIRALHEASAGWVPPPGAVWGGTPASTGPVTSRPELVSHRDYYPGNVVFRDGLPVALIDFDLAMPTTRLYDIANALWYWAPLRDPRDRAPAFADADIPAPGRGVRGRLRHDGAASRGAGAVRRRRGAPLSRGFPRLGRAGPGVPQAMGGRRQGRAAARRGVAAPGGPGDYRPPQPAGLGLAGGQAGDLGAGGRHQFLVGVRVASQAPAAVGCLGEQHPGPAGQGRVAGRVSGDGGQPLDYG